MQQCWPHTAELACNPGARVQGGCGDITTRANIQLRGVTLAEADQIIEGLVAHGLSSVMSGMDNVRNITGSPISGIDPHELLNVRQLTHGAWPPAALAGVLGLLVLPCSWVTFLCSLVPFCWLCVGCMSGSNGAVLSSQYGVRQSFVHRLLVLQRDQLQ